MPWTENDRFNNNPQTLWPTFGTLQNMSRPNVPHLPNI